MSNKKLSFKQISKNEWERGDFRSFACVNKKSDEILGDNNFDFEEHYIEGLGKAKTAFFITSNDNRFFITEHLEPRIPITEIFVLNSPKLKEDLREVLTVLNLKYSDLDWIDKTAV